MRIVERRALPDGPMTQPAEIILVHRDHEHHPWVTWQRNVPERGGDGGKYWGHYFGPDEEAKAREDFKTRGN